MKGYLQSGWLTQRIKEGGGALVIRPGMISLG